MSRFADPKATARLTLGPCECPGKPHTEDYMDVRAELGADDALAIAQGNSIDALEVLVTSWNLLDNDGAEAPVDRAHLSRLFADNYDVLNGWIEKNVRLSTLPNASAARSRGSSRASGSRTPKATTDGMSTTSSWQPADGATTTSGSPPPTS